MSVTVIPHSRIRSFVPRQGRITAGQQFALDNLWEQYGLDFNQSFDFNQVFEKSAPIVLEIGFGNGRSLAVMAAANPQLNYLGIEVHKPGVGQLMANLSARGLKNVKIFQQDAIDVLERQIPDHSLAAVQLFFPDPWPKRCHHKRRLVNANFVHLIRRKLILGGYFHAATDWQPYAHEMLKVLSNCQGLKNNSPQQDYCERPAYRPETKFERRGLKLGHGVWDLIFTAE
jgi:tRNA (guanine-N7-)-methyltransferase